ncbi:MAG: alpha-2-macroglobulin, partial [Saprospiraceae bacterium]
MLNLRSNQIAFLLLATITLLVSCKKKEAPRAKVMSDKVFAYIYAHTSGTISKTEPVTVRFTKPVVDADQIGAEAKEGVFTIQPALDGKAIWSTENTLIFEPSEGFDSGTQYLARVALDRVFDELPDGVDNFEFNFQVRKIFYEVMVDGLESVDLNDLSKQSVTGKVYFSERVDNEQVERMLEATQGNARRPITWEHSGRDHYFTIGEVRRSNLESKVNLKWNGEFVGVDYEGEESVKIPSLNDFTLLNAKIVQQAEPYVILNFSDPLLADQNLKGLIKFPGLYGKLRFDINGNKVRVYPSRMITGEQKVVANKGIKNVNKISMGEPATLDLYFQSPKPELRLSGNGVILPNSEGLIFPFEAIALEAVDVEIFKIHDNNILQFLQVNEIDQNGELERVGNVIYQKKLALKDLSPSANPLAWSHYAVDLEKLVLEDPHAIYQVRLGFRQNYALYDCKDLEKDDADNLALTESETQLENGEIKSFWETDDYYYRGYRWEHQDNPCFPAFYRNQNFVRRNVLMSNLGLVAKRGKSGSLLVSVSDIRNTKPLSDVQLSFYNAQNQLIHTMQTDGDGIAKSNLDKKAHLVVAEKGGQKGYLRMTDGYSLSLSRFDVEGVERQEGMKGYIYGERGVWRPGDSLFLHFVLENQDLPDNHPIQFQLFDPRGQLQEERNTVNNVNKVYPLHINTRPDAPTGDWNAVVTIGGATFRKNIKIETVKPNRLKVNLDFGSDELLEANGNITADLQVNWLHGAPARNLKAKSELELKPVNTTFKKFKEYEFDDPTRRFRGSPKVIFDGKLDNNGTASFSTKLNTNNKAPGLMQANIKTRAFETGGDFSTATQSMPYHPYENYAGVFLPKNEYNEKRLSIGESSNIDFVLVDREGKPKANRQLKVGIYRVSWRWWWDRDNENLSQYNSSNHMGAMESATLTTNNKGEIQWPVEVKRWGRYMVRVCDTESGHCSGDFFYAGYPWGEEGQNRDAAAMLNVEPDQESYEVGEEITLTIPGGEKGRCLISFENGEGVVETYWRDTKAGKNTFSFFATKEMVPTIYAHVSLMQPHADKKNDLPIRMYGLTPIKVEDAASKLSPELAMPKVLKPEENFALTISEKNGKEMAYTIAIVDDGLLDLTNFKTPNPGDAFFAKEALGVQTWDVYDHVLGAYGGELERVFSIGGDVAEVDPEKGKKANRFKPVVIHLGPFYLAPGESVKHDLKMPNYVGSVRAMVVAAGNGAYGNFEKTVLVKKPLMVLATLPRMLGPTELLSLPVNVFAMESKVKNVNVSVEERSGLVNFTNGQTQTVQFTSVGDKVINFDLDVSERVGVAQFVVTATGGGETTTQEIEIQVRNPNPFVSESFSAEVAKGADKTLNFKAVGMPGTNSAILEVSRIPSINLEERLNYLIRYPYGCLEQTTSSGFPQLFVKNLIPMDPSQQKEIEANIKATLEKLKTFQLANGNFSYWPGQSNYDAWGNSYAGHFMLEAEKIGYGLPVNMKKQWTNGQRRLAKEWVPRANQNSRYSYYSNRSWNLTQAYRLYTLALAEAPELGAMNRMLEDKDLHASAKWRLAAAYAVIGKPEVAEQLIKGLPTEFKSYRELSATYGSGLRDEAMVLETLSILGKEAEANRLVKRIAYELSDDQWLSTQTTAFSLMAIAKHVGVDDAGAPFEFAYTVNGGAPQNASATTPVMQIKLPVNGTGQQNIQLTNRHSKQLFT